MNNRSRAACAVPEHVRAVRHFGAGLLLLLLTACPALTQGDRTVNTPGSPALESVSYGPETVTALLNPERGFHAEADLVAGTGFRSARANGFALVRSVVRLDDYRYEPLPEDLLERLGDGFAAARRQGVKVILRFSYNFGFDDDAPLDTVLTHLEQLAPLFEENADVIAVMQGGFIGAWGEWHASTNDLTEPAAKRAITAALLRAVPENRMIQLRSPWHVRTGLGAPPASLTPFSAEPHARTGLHNDCFLSTADDSGTYGKDQTEDRRQAATRGRHTVTGGETCTHGWPAPRQSCDTALTELAQFGWDYLNSGYYAEVLERWQEEGCFTEISERLGYRLIAESAAAPDSAAAGGPFSLRLRLHNNGFGKVYNPRPLDIVLRNTATGVEFAMRALSDARTALPLASETRDLDLSVSLPTNLPAGTYQVGVRLPDASPRLQDDARYAIRLANADLWDDTAGANMLQLSTVVAE